MQQIRLDQFIASISDVRQPIIERIYRDHHDLIHTAPGSTHIHQVWEGGLADHLADMYRLCLDGYLGLQGFLAERGETLPFTLGNAQIAIFCHDAEKMIVYGDPKDPRCDRFIGKATDPMSKAFKEALKWDVLKDWEDRYGLVLTDAEVNAVKYAHGEGKDYRNDRRVMNELAAFVGNIDRTSARILYNSGKNLG